MMRLLLVEAQLGSLPLYILLEQNIIVLVLEKEKFGGQITITSDIVNYPGVLEDSGEGLTIKMRKQAENFGASFQKAHVKSLHLQQPIKKVETDQGIYESVGLVLAPGAHPRKLGFPGEKEYQGRGIAYCATCDGEFFEGCHIFVIGEVLQHVKKLSFNTICFKSNNDCERRRFHMCQNNC